MKWLYAILFSFVCYLPLMAGDPVLQVFDGKDYKPFSWEEIDFITYESGALIIHLNNGDKDKVYVSDELEIPSAPTLPLFEINTVESLTEIPNREDYKDSEFQLKGFGDYDDVTATGAIRGRGNTSWYFPKKPYRLKFDKKVSLCGLPAAKSYVLLANYNDCSLIQNALAFKIGEMLKLPYTNRFVPVDVKLNGIYKGSYLLTNKPGINSGSVDIDEDNSIMWELDQAYDEEFKFRSPLLDLPVMVADPDLIEKKFEEWKADFIAMERAAVQYKASSLVDMDILARYVLVYEILKNDEIGWPKSVKLFKTKGGKYIFGPIWDFDTAMGKVWGEDSYTTGAITQPVWKNKLLRYLENDPQYKESIKNAWKEIRETLPEILDFIDLYSEEIYSSANRNQIIWTDLEDYELSVKKLKQWLRMRFIALEMIIEN